MPIVPTFHGGVPQVRDNGGSGFVPARSPAVNVDAYGRMMQQAMRPVEEWSNSLTEALRIEHQRTVKAESDDAERQVIDAINARMSGENGYMTQQGKNAMDAFRPTVEGMTADVDKIVGSLQPQVREVIGSRIQDRLSSAVEQARRWNGQQTRAYHMQSSEARVHSLMSDADNHYAETGYLQKTWGSITQEIDYQAAMMGLPAEQVKRLKDQSYDLFTARRFEAWGSDNPVLALQVFKSQRPKVSADIAARIESGLFSKSRDTLALGLAQRPVRYSTTEEFEEQDFTDQYNTQLTPEEEREFQAWAKAEGRERDVFNYDLRGAWKELKSGTMSEDARGHLGDKYKKPNHPTFSDQSIYSTEENRGGHWSVENGQDVFVPGRELSAAEANYLQQYFAEREPGVQLKARVKDSVGAVVDDWYTNPSSLTGDPFIDSLKNDQRLSVVLRARQLRSQMIQMRGDEFNTQVKNNLAEALLGNNPEKMALDQFTEAYGPKKGLKQFKQYELDYEEAQFKFNARNMSDADIDAYLKAMKPVSGSEDFAARTKLYQASVKAANEIKKERQADKVGYALKNEYGSFKALDWDNAAQVQDQLTYRVNEMTLMKERWGGEKQILSKDEVQTLTQHFNALESDDQVKFLTSIAAPLSGDGVLSVLGKQIKPEDSRIGTALFVMDNNIENGGRYLRGRQFVDEKRLALPTKGEGSEEDFGRILGTEEGVEGISKSSSVRATMVDAAQGMWAYEQIAGSGATSEDIVSSAFGDIADYNGKKIFLPKRPSGASDTTGTVSGWFSRDFFDLIDLKIKSMAKDKTVLKTMYGEVEARYFAPKIRGMRLESVGDGQYRIIDPELGYVRNADNTPYVLDLNPEQVNVK